MSTFILCVRHENYYFGKRSQLNYSKLSKSRNFKHNNSFDQNCSFLPEINPLNKDWYECFVNCTSYLATLKITEHAFSRNTFSSKHFFNFQKNLLTGKFLWPLSSLLKLHATLSTQTSFLFVVQPWLYQIISMVSKCILKICFDNYIHIWYDISKQTKSEGRPGVQRL